MSKQNNQMKTALQSSIYSLNGDIYNYTIARYLKAEYLSDVVNKTTTKIPLDGSTVTIGSFFKGQPVKVVVTHVNANDASTDKLPPSSKFELEIENEAAYDAIGKILKLHSVTKTDKYFEWPIFESNDNVRIISSAPKKDESTGVIYSSAHAFTGTPAEKFDMPNQQFVADLSDGEPFKIGFVLDKLVGEVSFNKISILPLIPKEKKLLYQCLSGNCLGTPVPAKITFFGTRSVVDLKTCDIEKDVEWEKIGDSVCVDLNSWSYANHRNFVWDTSNNEKIESYRGLLIQVDEWFAENGTDAEGFGFANLKFDFTPDLYTAEHLKRSSFVMNTISGGNDNEVYCIDLVKVALADNSESYFTDGQTLAKLNEKISSMSKSIDNLKKIVNLFQTETERRVELLDQQRYDNMLSQVHGIVNDNSNVVEQKLSELSAENAKLRQELADLKNQVSKQVNTPAEIITPELCVIDDNLEKIRSAGELRLESNNRHGVIIQIYTNLEQLPDVTAPIVLPEKAEDGDFIEITNLRNDGGQISIKASGTDVIKVVNLNGSSKTDVFSELVLDTAGEEIKATYLSGKWHCSITSTNCTAMEL